MCACAHTLLLTQAKTCVFKVHVEGKATGEPRSRGLAEKHYGARTSGRGLGSRDIQAFALVKD
jgi:hypothetical protein